MVSDTQARGVIMTDVTAIFGQLDGQLDGEPHGSWSRTDSGQSSGMHDAGQQPMAYFARLSRSWAGEGEYEFSGHVPSTPEGTVVLVYCTQVGLGSRLDEAGSDVVERGGQERGRRSASPYSTLFRPPRTNKMSKSFPISAPQTLNKMPWLTLPHFRYASLFAPRSGAFAQNIREVNEFQVTPSVGVPGDCSFIAGGAVPDITSSSVTMPGGKAYETSYREC